MFSASAIAQSLFTTGIGRVVPIMFQKVARRGKVEAAMRAGATGPVNSAIQSALMDFEIVIGNSYGELTVSLDNFLRKLESSGLVVAMAEEAIAQKETEHTKQSFMKLHASVFEAGGGNGTELYDKITKAFRASMSALINDPALALLLKTLSDDIISRLDRIETCAVSLDIQTQNNGNRVDIDSAMARISRALIADFKDIRVETSKGAKIVSIERIYVPSRLRQRNEPEAAKEIFSLDQSTRRGKFTSPRGMIGPSDNIGFIDFRNGFRRAVVLGDPGGGKSTLCQFLCHSLAKQFALKSQYPDKNRQDFHPQALKIPLRIVLRSYESARARAPQLGVFDFLINQLRSSCSTLSNQQIEECLKYMLTFGHAVLAFDGLDEILSTGTRREFVDIVHAFCEQFPLCPVFVTSRLVGYENAPLPSEFEEFTLEKFDDREVQVYVEKFLKVFSGTKTDAGQRAQKFMLQTSRTAGDLRQNPLMLGLMAFLFASKDDVPTNRPEIYRECAILMFEKWDQNRNIEADIPKDFDMLHLFGEIASKIYGSAELEEGVSSNWIRKVNTDYFTASVYEDKQKAFNAGRKVTEFVTGRSWVMSEFSSDCYRFTHRTFMEYFFARKLEEGHETIPELVEVLSPHIILSEWDVISHLAVQIKTFRNPRRTSQFIEQMRRFLRANATDAHNVAICNFFAGSLQYVLPSEIECKLAVADILEVIGACVNNQEPAVPFNIVLTIANCVSDRREYVHQILAERLIDYIKLGPDHDGFAFYAMLLSSPRSMWVPRPARAELPLPLIRASQAKLKADMQRLAQSDIFSAFLFWEWYQEDYDILHNIHGFQFILSDKRPWSNGPRSGTELIAHIVLRFSNYLYDRSEGTIKEKAKAALQAIGRNLDIKLQPTDISIIGGARAVFPPDIWRVALSSASADKDLIKGLLFSYILIDLLPRKVSDPADMRPSAGRAVPSKLDDAINKSVARLNEGERAFFGSFFSSPI